MTTPNRPVSSASAPTVLVVDPVIADRQHAASTLAAAGFQVTAADSFGSAKERMAARPPTVLLSEVCLAEFNGLHLVIRGRFADPKMVAIVTCDHEDVFLRAEAERMGATFVVKPISDKELLATVLRTLFRTGRDMTPIRPPLERRVGERRARSGVYGHPERRLSDRRRPLTELLPVTVN